MAARRFFSLIPLDAYILCVPMGYACLAMGGLVYKTLRFDPEQSTLRLYEEGSESELLSTSSTYKNTVPSLFRGRIKGHETWSVPLWSNEPAVSHPHS